MLERRRPLVYLVCLLVAVEAANDGLTCSCGWVNKGRIYKGTEVPANKYPMIVLLEDAKREPYCGGTIITPEHILTAAHCTSDGPSDILVRVGAHRRKGDGTEYKVKTVIVHENYSRGMIINNDIAIIVTEKRMQFSDIVGPACLPNTEESLSWEDGIVMGWGGTDKEFRASVLQETTLKIVFHDLCKRTWQFKFVEETMFCAIMRDKDILEGDSGGPLLWLDPKTNRYTLVGVVSFSDGILTGRPVIIMKVSAYIDWIKQKIPLEILCTEE